MQQGRCTIPLRHADGALPAQARIRVPDSCAVCTSGIVGCAGLQPTVAAIEQGKDICLANKETLIAGGPYVLPLAAKYGVNILPADSEHSAIFQCIQVCCWVAEATLLTADCQQCMLGSSRQVWRHPSCPATRSKLPSSSAYRYSLDIGGRTRSCSIETQAQRAMLVQPPCTACRKRPMRPARYKC